MAEKKIYNIDGKEFYLKEDVPLRDRIILNKLMMKMPTKDNKQIEGLTLEETIQFMQIILAPVEKDTDMSIVEKIDEETETKLFVDFFFRRLNLMRIGMKYLVNIQKN